ncbi:MAG: SDR family NAD(P)-dependent oxidoreductase, partial [Calditrichaeota bacterium]
FDADFFGFFPKEAEHLDPQHRIFMECAWEALEDGGYAPEDYQGLIGVFAGVGMNSYVFPVIAATQGKIGTAEGYQLSIGNEKDFLTTKVSYKFNLRGLSMDVQTACSTSLTATFLACQSLANFQVDMVLAGGCTISTPQKVGYVYQEGMILSPDGHCRAFDADANGTIAGNGCGVVLLKRLEDALADRDHIYAVIKGAACNNDGSQKVGYTAPSVDGQAQVISEAQFVAGLHPEDISYVESHGTGTNLGDPIEIAALNKVFQQKTKRRRYCAIGSVKPNIGHLDSAAGVASLIKTAMALKRKQIPPSINFKRPNSKIDFESSPFYVNSELKEWVRNGKPLTAGVSSFGIGGTNVHLVLQEAPERIKTKESRKYELVLLSARSMPALQRMRENLVAFLKENSDLNLSDVAYTLQQGRKAFPVRMAAVCHSLSDAIQTLESVNPERVMMFNLEKDAAEKSYVFMFSGQGAQYVNMGADLYRQEPVFRDQIDACADFLLPVMGIDLREILYPPQDRLKEAEEKLQQTKFTQPLLFVIEYALAQLWKSWGIEPQAMIGHSIGEYVAACLADVMSLEDALKLVALRGELMQSLPAGAMLGLSLSLEEIKPFLHDQLSIAAINGDKLLTVSGTFEAIDDLEKKLSDSGIDSTRLHTSHAFHSSMMEPILSTFTDFVSSVYLKAPQIPYISNVTGTWIRAEEATDPQYYARHLRSTVQFNLGIGELLKNLDYIFLEVGSGKTLATLARRHANALPQHVILSSIHHPKENYHDQDFILHSLARLWLADGRVDWQRFNENFSAYRIPLPTYPFERQKYWLDIEAPALTPKKIRLRGKNSDVAQWFYQPVWKRRQLRKINDDDRHRYLLFVDMEDNDVLQRLIAAGHEIKTVQSGSSFQADSNRIVIKYDDEADYGLLVEWLKEQNYVPDRIVHAWTMSSRDARHSLQRGFYSLLWLVKALVHAGLNDTVKMIVATRVAFDVIGDETLHCENATLSAACKVISQEFPNFACRFVDTDEYNLDRVLHEFNADSAEVTIAYRHKTRWVQKFENYELNNSASVQTILKQNGTYLITGGVGNIALALADYLAENCQAKLVLVDRVPFPERSEWDSIIQEADSALAQKIKKIQKIEEKGEVLILAADITDKAQMHEIFQWTREHFGAINGVIHAAGLVGAAATVSIPETNEQVIRTHLEPKLIGSQVLADLLNNEQLDFVLLQSSLSTVLGGIGMYAYASANAYLDAISAIQNRKSSTLWMSVNWDGWRFDHEPFKSGFEELSMTPTEGIKAFDLLFKNMGVPQIVVSTGELMERIQQWVTLETRTLQTGIGITQRHPRPNIVTPFAPPRDDFEREMAETWGELLGIDGIGIYDDFFDLGGHSLLATQLISRLRDKYRIDLPLRSLFESPTIATVSDTIRKAQESHQPDDDKIAEALKMVEGLTDEQVRQMLMQQDE